MLMPEIVLWTIEQQHRTSEMAAMRGEDGGDPREKVFPKYFGFCYSNQKFVHPSKANLLKDNSVEVKKTVDSCASFLFRIKTSLSMRAAVLHIFLLSMLVIWPQGSDSQNIFSYPHING